MFDRRTVQPSRWRSLTGLSALGVVLALVAAWLVPTSAMAELPPDLSGSKLICQDTDGGAVRRADDLTCALTTALAPGTENADISATVTLPNSVEFDSAPHAATYDVVSRVITFGETALGFTFSSQSRIVVFHVSVAGDVLPDDQITLPADITAVGSVDQVISTKSVNSPPLVVSPFPADLADSTITCSDVNGGTLLPGESVACDLMVTNLSGHEDAAFVVGSISMSHASWLSGGTSSSPASTSFGTDDLGTIAAGASKQLSATFAINDSALGGDVVTPSAFLAGLSTPSNSSIILSRVATSMVVSPGKADLTGSALGCTDTNGGVLLAGDEVRCDVSVSAAAGHEGVEAATATLPLPDHTVYLGGADTFDGGRVVLGPAQLGSVLSGTTRTAGFSLKIASGTSVGEVVTPYGELTATSVPVGGPVEHLLTGNALVVGQAVAIPGQAAVGAPTGPGGAVVHVTPSYTLRAKTIRILLRRGHRRASHLWRGSKRRTVFVKRYVVRTPKTAGKVVKKVTVPKKGKNAPRRGKVRIKGTRLTYTIKKGKRRTDRFRYTVTDTAGKKATGKVIVTWEKRKK